MGKNSGGLLRYRLGTIADRLILLLLLGAVCLFILWPMLCILLRSLGDGEGGFSLAAYAEVWQRYRGNLWNSIFVGVLSSLSALFSPLPLLSSSPPGRAG